MFIVAIDIVKRPLCRLFNFIFEHGIMLWSRSIIAPLHTNVDREDVNNYRGIEIVSNLGKTMSTIFNPRLLTWAEYNILCLDQFGFRKETTDCISVLQSILTKILAIREKLCSAFIDFKEVSDKVIYICFGCNYLHVE